MDELPVAARELLQAARYADDPTADERSRADLRARAALERLGLTDLPAPRAPEPLPLSAATKPAVAASLKLGIVAVGIVALATAYFVLQKSSRAPEPQPATSATATTLPPASTLPAPSAVIVEHPPEPVATTQAHARAKPTQSSSDATLQHELRVLAQVDALIRGAHYRPALQLLERSDRATHGVKLLEERAALRVLALCGQAPNARALAARERFLSRFPEAVLAARVRAACESRP